MPKLLALVLLALVALAPNAAATTETCDKGELCLWTNPNFEGQSTQLALTTTNQGECVPLTMETRSFANLLTRPVVVYQSEECATEGEFDTYPGHGTYVPSAPFVVRAIQIPWS